MALSLCGVIPICTFGFSQSAMAATLYVDDSADCSVSDGSVAKPFCTIQTAVDTAVSGDTVKAAAGFYSEDVGVVNKALKLLGADPNTTTIQGFSSDIYMSGFEAPAKNVEIANFTITGASDYGIAYDSSNLTGNVHNCIFINNRIGLGVWGANVRASNNVITGSSEYGVHTNSNGTLALANSILINNNYGVYALSGWDGFWGECTNSSRINSSYNRYFENTHHRHTDYCGAISSFNDSDDSDPKFVDFIAGNYKLQPDSPCIDAGSPAVADKDRDGTRNDQGIYGGPGYIPPVPKTFPIAGTAPWKTLHTVTCENVTTNQKLVIPKTKKSAWNCEDAGLTVNSGDAMKVTIEGKKF